MEIKQPTGGLSILQQLCLSILQQGKKAEREKERREIVLIGVLNQRPGALQALWNCIRVSQGTVHQAKRTTRLGPELQKPWTWLRTTGCLSGWGPPVNCSWQSVTLLRGHNRGGNP